MAIQRAVPLLVCLFMGLAGLGAASAQTPADSAVKDTAGTPEAEHHGGFMSKVKKVAQNKVVQEVAKVAACNVVPGGRLVVGAVDAATSKSASGAAQGAAEAATGAGCSNATGQLTTAPDRALEHAVTPPLPSGQPPVDPRAQAGLDMMKQMGMGPATDDESQARCLGVSVEEYRLIVYPPGMNTRPPTPAEEAARTAAMKKLDPKKQQECSMRQMGQTMTMVQKMTADMQNRMAPSGGGAMSEAPGQAVSLPSDLASALKSGKVVVRGIDWVAGTTTVSATGTAGVEAALAQLGAAMRDAGGDYRLDLYFMDRYDDDAATGLAPGRTAAIESLLEAGGEDAAHLASGQVRRDHDARLEIVRTR